MTRTSQANRSTPTMNVSRPYPRISVAGPQNARSARPASPCLGLTRLSDSSHKGATFRVSPSVREMGEFSQRRRMRGPLRLLGALLGRNPMIEQAHTQSDPGGRRASMCPCAHAVVDLLVGQSYHMAMRFRRPLHLADRPDPERQGRAGADRRRDAESSRSSRARLSIPPAAALMTTDRSPSSFSRHTARTAPPSLPAIASALARQRFSSTSHHTDTTAVGRRSIGARS